MALNFVLLGVAIVSLLLACWMVHVKDEEARAIKDNYARLLSEAKSQNAALQAKLDHCNRHVDVWVGRCQAEVDRADAAEARIKEACRVMKTNARTEVSDDDH